jgi:hypothetical protein
VIVIPQAAGTAIGQEEMRLLVAGSVVQLEEVRTETNTQAVVTLTQEVLRAKGVLIIRETMPELARIVRWILHLWRSYLVSVTMAGFMWQYTFSTNVPWHDAQ